MCSQQGLARVLHQMPHNELGIRAGQVDLPSDRASSNEASERLILNTRIEIAGVNLKKDGDVITRGEYRPHCVVQSAFVRDQASTIELPVRSPDTECKFKKPMARSDCYARG